MTTTYYRWNDLDTSRFVYFTHLRILGEKEFIKMINSRFNFKRHLIEQSLDIEIHCNRYEGANCKLKIKKK